MSDTIRQDLDLVSPWMNAAGTLGFAPPTTAGHAPPTTAGHAPLERWNWPFPAGAWVTNPLSLGPRAPAESRAGVSFPGGALIHSGLQNPGLNAVLRRNAGHWARSPIPAWVHIFGRTPDEIHSMVLRLENVEGVAAIELGIGYDYSGDEALTQVDAALGELPLVVSLPLTRAGETWLNELPKLGASALTLAGPRGLLPGPDGHLVGGRLYGPALLPHMLAAVQYLRQRFRLPIIAGAGVYHAADGEALLRAGAWGIQIDTVLWL